LLYCWSRHRIFVMTSIIFFVFFCLSFSCLLFCFFLFVIHLSFFWSTHGIFTMVPVISFVLCFPWFAFVLVHLCSSDQDIVCMRVLYIILWFVGQSLHDSNVSPNIFKVSFVFLCVRWFSLCCVLCVFCFVVVYCFWVWIYLWFFWSRHCMFAMATDYFSSAHSIFAMFAVHFICFLVCAFFVFSVFCSLFISSFCSQAIVYV